MIALSEPVLRIVEGRTRLIEEPCRKRQGFFDRKDF